MPRTLHAVRKRLRSVLAEKRVRTRDRPATKRRTERPIRSRSDLTVVYWDSRNTDELMGLKLRLRTRRVLILAQRAGGVRGDGSCR
jgi:hypothetical protein